MFYIGTYTFILFYYSKVRVNVVNGRIGHDGSNCIAVAIQSADAVKSPSVSITWPRLNHILGQLGSILAASFNIFSAKRGSPKM